METLLGFATDELVRVIDSKTQPGTGDDLLQITSSIAKGNEEAAAAQIVDVSANLIDGIDGEIGENKEILPLEVEEPQPIATLSTEVQEPPETILEKEEGMSLPLVASIVLVAILLVIAAIYFWCKKQRKTRGR